MMRYNGEVGKWEVEEGELPSVGEGKRKLGGVIEI